MSGYTALKIDDIEGAYGGAFKRVRASLGVESFGMQIIDMPANADQYPEHDHAGDGQEEVYTALEGSGWLDIEGERVELADGVLVRIAPEATRKVHSGPEGLQMLVIGGRPGQPYEVSEFTELETA